MNANYDENILRMLYTNYNIKVIHYNKNTVFEIFLEDSIKVIVFNVNGDGCEYDNILKKNVIKNKLILFNGHTVKIIDLDTNTVITEINSSNTSHGFIEIDNVAIIVINNNEAIVVSIDTCNITDKIQFNNYLDKADIEVEPIVKLGRLTYNIIFPSRAFISINGHNGNIVTTDELIDTRYRCEILSRKTTFADILYVENTLVFDEDIQGGLRVIHSIKRVICGNKAFTLFEYLDFIGISNIEEVISKYTKNSINSIDITTKNGYKGTLSNNFRKLVIPSISCCNILDDKFEDKKTEYNL